MANSVDPDLRHLIWVYTVYSGPPVPILWVIKVHFCHCRVFRKLQGQVHSVSLKGVEDAYSKHTDDKSEPKGIKAHFKMDENGILSLEQVSRYFVCGLPYWPSRMGILGPVVQSVVSLTSSLRVISLTVLADSIYNILIFFAEKM